jgi:hypothetical protein
VGRDRVKRENVEIRESRMERESGGGLAENGQEMEKGAGREESGRRKIKRKRKEKEGDCGGGEERDLAARRSAWPISERGSQRRRIENPCCPICISASRTVCCRFPSN